MAQRGSHLEEAGTGHSRQDISTDLAHQKRSVVDLVRRLYTYRYHAIEDFLSSRICMATLLVLVVMLYLWNVQHALDYPEWDESTYFNRGFNLFNGNFAVANVRDPLSSPLWVSYYAAWYALLRTSLVYPLVFASSIMLIGIGAYLLLSRLFSPLLSWLLAVLVVVGTTPISPGNACFYFGTGVLWVSLSFLGSKVWSRGLAAVGVLLSGLIRPEFFTCAAVLLVCLAIYEWTVWRSGRVEWRALATSYAPVVGALFTLAYAALTLPAQGYDRVSDAIPWSYNDWYNATHNPAFQGFYSYDHLYIIFQKDFGPVPSHTLLSILIAMTHNPAKLGAYLWYEAQMLWASLGSAALQTYQWRSDQWATRLSITRSAQDTWQFALGVLAFALIAVLCWWSSQPAGRSPRRLARLQLPALPTLFAYASLASIFIWLLLILPNYRFFMVYPIVLAPIGYGLRSIGRRLPLPAWASVVIIPIVLLGIPHPYASTPPHPVASMMKFLEDHVPRNSTVLTESSATFSNYLAADGVRLNMLETGDYAEPVLVNAFLTDPSLQYVLMTQTPTEFYSDSTYQHWFSEWNARFPDLQWSSVAQQADPAVTLFKLPAGAGELISYRQLLQQAAAQGLASSSMPPVASMNFDQIITWHPSASQNDVTPTYRTAWGMGTSAIIMHPNAPGVDPTVPHLMTASLPLSWSGGTLLFAATLAPWAADQLGASGVRLVFSIPGTSYSQTFQIPNSYPNEHWLPMAVRLPRFSGSTTLQVTILPRASLRFDTTFFSFIGFAASKAAGAVP